MLLDGGYGSIEQGTECNTCGKPLTMEWSDKWEPAWFNNDGHALCKEHFTGRPLDIPNNNPFETPEEMRLYLMKYIRDEFTPITSNLPGLIYNLLGDALEYLPDEKIVEIYKFHILQPGTELLPVTSEEPEKPF